MGGKVILQQLLFFWISFLLHYLVQREMCVVFVRDLRVIYLFTCYTTCTTFKLKSNQRINGATKLHRILRKNIFSLHTYIKPTSSNLPVCACRHSRSKRCRRFVQKKTQQKISQNWTIKMHRIKLVF